jgi:cupin 2 domain-containing protein
MAATGGDGESDGVAQRVLRGNLLESLPAPKSLAEEKMDDLLSTPRVVFRRIVSTGQCTPEGSWYEQEEDEWVMVLEGEGVVAYEDGTATALTAGAWVHLPARLKHRVSKTSDRCVWLAVHFQ